MNSLTVTLAEGVERGELILEGSVFSFDEKIFCFLVFFLFFFARIFTTHPWTAILYIIYCYTESIAVHEPPFI